MTIELTPEQLSLLPSYRSRWQQSALSLDPLHRPTVAETLNTAYRLSGYPSPALFFFDTPHQAIEHLGFPTIREPLVLAMLASPVIKQVQAQFAPLLWTQFWRRGGHLYAVEMNRMVSDPLVETVRERFGMSLPDPIERAVEAQSSMISDGALLDFCITVLGCTHTMTEHWQTVTALVQQCF
ncbi:hypothetical protein [Leptothoe sp. PORK10 BA2]|uniref:hypothetical protein n=1 Tax=Leptothoe sp. PORK10 BA2 TaxID=3110254 RepID=UPI002B1FCBD2|nr:hypothetical protein [Leptothoe sp. PORK10 BA2]MEA5464793.1 hypothetical protein [Leptothoe sp. PORK10 BA2]